MQQLPPYNAGESRPQNDPTKLEKPATQKQGFFRKVVQLVKGDKERKISDQFSEITWTAPDPIKDYKQTFASKFPPNCKEAAQKLVESGVLSKEDVGTLTAAYQKGTGTLATDYKAIRDSRHTMSNLLDERIKAKPEAKRELENLKMIIQDAFNAVQYPTGLK